MGKQITIIGCGPGAPDLITIRGKEAIEKADMVIGSKRLINDFIKKASLKTLILDNNYKEILDQAGQLYKQNKKLIFLVSGDPLFYSFGKSVLDKFGQDNCEVIPGISSVQYAFSRLKESWKEYRTFTLHGTNDIEIQKIFDENDKFVLLLDPGNNLKMIKSKLNSKSVSNCKFNVVSNLSLPSQRILDIKFEDFDKVEEESLSILIVTRISN
ncbi:MAG TPA: precorrin-6y C5,15-methyltransferase (decarboxylating) subunit CbiE [Nitrospinota bacterium]|nr:precorrin-6y C5,15-methyltransferase (decarboxylating) subunit CbiE [Nitrospinota bacterium]